MWLRDREEIFYKNKKEINKWKKLKNKVINKPFTSTFGSRMRQSWNEAFLKVSRARTLRQTVRARCWWLWFARHLLGEARVAMARRISRGIRCRAFYMFARCFDSLGGLARLRCCVLHQHQCSHVAAWGAERLDGLHVVTALRARFTFVSVGPTGIFAQNWK